jgi:hypothetical protein
MAISPTNIRIIFTNYDIIAYFLNLALCSEHWKNCKQIVLHIIDNTWVALIIFL